MKFSYFSPLFFRKTRQILEKHRFFLSMFAIFFVLPTLRNLPAHAEGEKEPVYPMQIEVPKDADGNSLEKTMFELFSWTGDPSEPTNADVTHLFTWGSDYDYTRDSVTNQFTLDNPLDDPLLVYAKYTNSCFTIDLNGQDVAFDNILVRNNSAMKLTNGTGVTVNTAVIEGHSGLGDVWLDDTNLTWAPSSFWKYELDETTDPNEYKYVKIDDPLSQADQVKGALTIEGIYGNGTITNKYEFDEYDKETQTYNENVNKIFVNNGVSPSFWQQYDASATKAGRTLTFTSEGLTNPLTVDFGGDSVITTFMDGATGTFDQVVVEGTAEFEEGYFLQPVLAGATTTTKADATNAPETVTFLTATNINVPTARQQYAWADASLVTEPNVYPSISDETSFSMPVVYSIDYSDPTKITINKQFTWDGNFLAAIDYSANSYNKNVFEIAETFNYMLQRGNEGTNYFTDDPVFLNIAWLSQSSDGGATAAARALKQFTAETYATRIPLTALNGIRQSDMALEQMSNVRQYLGYPSRKATCGNGVYQDTEKHENYGPFFSQLRGPQQWYFWGTPTGQWINRENDRDTLAGFYGYDYHQYGLNVGMARNLGAVTIGFSGGWQSSDFDAKGTNHHIDIESWQATFMAIRSFDNFFAEAWLGYNQDSDDSTRSVLAGGTLGAPASISVNSSYDIQGWTGGFNLGTNYQYGGITLTPTAGFRFGTAKNGEIHETINPNAELTLDRKLVGIYELPIGLRASTCQKTANGWVLAPSAKAEYVFRVGERQFETEMYYRDFYATIRGSELSDEFHFATQLCLMKDQIHANLGYDGNLGDHFFGQQASVTVGYVF